jgi:hypothetical protein
MRVKCFSCPPASFKKNAAICFTFTSSTPSASLTPESTAETIPAQCKPFPYPANPSLVSGGGFRRSRTSVRVGHRQYNRMSSRNVASFSSSIFFAIWRLGRETVLSLTRSRSFGPAVSSRWNEKTHAIKNLCELFPSFSTLAAYRSHRFPVYFRRSPIENTLRCPLHTQNRPNPGATISQMKSAPMISARPTSERRATAARANGATACAPGPSSPTPRPWPTRRPTRRL